MTTRSDRLTAGVALTLAALTYLTGETLAAAAWRRPRYHYAGNFVSDLGVTTCGTFSGRTLCSPRHAVMNAALVGQGLLAAAAAPAGMRLARQRGSTSIDLLSRGYGLGMLTVGTFHNAGDRLGGEEVVHDVGAGLAVLAGNLAALSTGARWHEVGAPRWIGVVSGTLGAVGLVCGLTVLAIRREPGFGIVERGSIYPVTAWQLMVGTHLLYRALRDPDPAA